MVNTAQQGRRLEHEVRHDLESLGFTVLRMAGSKGACDLIAIRPRSWLFVQVKRSGVLGPVGWNALYDLAQMAGAIPVLAERLPRKPIRYQLLLARKEKPGRQPFEELDIRVFLTTTAEEF